MCLLNRQGEVLGFLHQNWEQPPAILTSDPAEAWACAAEHDGVGFAKAMNSFYASAFEDGSQFALRARRQCPQQAELRAN